MSFASSAMTNQHGSDVVRPVHVQRLPASMVWTMETFWSRRIHVVLKRHPSSDGTTLCACTQIPRCNRANSRTLKRKVGLRKIRHLSLDVQNAGTVCPMVTDAPERVLEICKKKERGTQRVFNSHRRGMQRTLGGMRLCTWMILTPCKRRFRSVS